MKKRHIDSTIQIRFEKSKNIRFFIQGYRLHHIYLRTQSILCDVNMHKSNMESPALMFQYMI